MDTRAGERDRQAPTLETLGAFLPLNDMPVNLRNAADVAGRLGGT
jgi:hypothetical protein